MEQETNTESRRKILKFAVYTPPALMLMSKANAGYVKETNGIIKKRHPKDGKPYRDRIKRKVKRKAVKRRAKRKVAKKRNVRRKVAKKRNVRRKVAKKRNVRRKVAKKRSTIRKILKRYI